MQIIGENIKIKTFNNLEKRPWEKDGVFVGVDGVDKASETEKYKTILSIFDNVPEKKDMVADAVMGSVFDKLDSRLTDMLADYDTLNTSTYAMELLEKLNRKQRLKFI